MRRAIVHIGTPRTGTTTLQRILHRLRPDLAALGILYPDLTPASATEPHLSHQHLGETLDGRRPAAERAELLGRLDALLRTTQADTVLLSYEGLCLVPAWRRAPSRLRAVFDAHGFAMQTLISIKPQGEYLNSMYTWRAQFLREGRRFPAFLRKEIGSGQLDYRALLRPWRAASARADAVPVRDARDGRPLVARMLDTAGLLDRAGPLLTPADTALRENRSPGPFAVEACRRLHAGGAQRTLGPSIREATRLIEDLARDRGLDAAPFRGLDDAMRRQVALRWAAANARLAQECWARPWPDTVAEEPAQPANALPISNTGPNATMDAAAEASVDQLVRDACARHGITLRTGWAARLLVTAPHALVDRVRAGLGV